LVGVTLLGLCAAGALAGDLMQREMRNARLDQAKIDCGRDRFTPHDKPRCRNATMPQSVVRD